MTAGTARAAIGACFLAACVPAWAQGAAPEPARAAEVAAPAAASASVTPLPLRPLWEFGLGAAVLRLPDYRGADQGHTYALPLPYVVYRGTWLKADREGARALLVNTERIKVDVSLAASTPTRSSDNSARAGMPNLPGTAEIGPNLNITLASGGGGGGSGGGGYTSNASTTWRLDLRLPVRAAVALQRSPRHVGNTFSPHLNLDHTVGGWHVGLQAGPLFADRKYHEHFYGVDAAYATAARPAYAAHGGYAGWNALAATSRRFGPMWVGSFVRHDSLRGAVFEPSPLVRRATAWTFGIGVSWVLAQSSELVPGAD